MTTAVYFDTNALFISDMRDAFVAGTLVCERDGDLIGICRANEGSRVLQRDYRQIVRKDGTGFDSAIEAQAYLDGEFVKRRPVGTVITPYALLGVASFAVDHGLAYAPRTTVVGADGAEVDTDVVHAPGQTVLTFATPFTGTLYLG